MITTHVLDTSLGKPAAGISVTLEVRGPDDWSPVARGTTDADGRVRELVPQSARYEGRYRLVFDTAAYFTARGVAAFYPVVVVVFDIADPAQHYHVPLLLSPFGYSTYRGS